MCLAARCWLCAKMLILLAIAQVPPVPSFVVTRPILTRVMSMQPHYVAEVIFPIMAIVNSILVSPGRNEPLPDSPIVNMPEAEHIKEKVERGKAVEEDLNQTDADGDEGKDGSQTYWHDWKTMLLIEMKKEKLLANSRQSGRLKCGKMIMMSGRRPKRPWPHVVLSSRTGS
ncbi:hypothetical protein R1sor_001154 [Riccia sorocarpa]|uniref:Uncharacterized protein n=1 Tax=Riccia sorocarpa TaxID=122646 RepID=A0ABD3GV54_9MARC